MFRSQELSYEKQKELIEDEEDWCVYKVPDSLPSCDKEQHFKRSCINQPNHARVEKKIVRKRNLVKVLLGIEE